jgi:hypothetical protein
VKARHVYARTLRTYWRRAGFLLVLGVLVFVPVGLLEALAERVDEVHTDEILDLATVALILGLLAQAAVALLGEVFYAGAVGLAMRRGEASRPPPLREVARRLSYGPLIAVDLLFGFGTAIGLLLLVVPGVVFFGWFALAGPIVELEGRGVRAAFARSRQLVRGSFWTVLVVLVPITIASELLADALLELPHLVIHNALFRDWVGSSVSSILLSPLYAVAAVLMTLQLSGARPEDALQVAKPRASGRV